MGIGAFLPRPVRVLRKQRGALVVEAFAALMLVVVTSVPLLAGIATMHHSNVRFEERATADNIARNQMVDIFAQPYQEPPYTYSPISTPEGYSLTAQAVDTGTPSPGLAMIRVKVYHGEKEVASLETLRVNR